MNQFRQSLAGQHAELIRGMLLTPMIKGYAICMTNALRQLPRIRLVRDQRRTFHA